MKTALMQRRPLYDRYACDDSAVGAESYSIQIDSTSEYESSADYCGTRRDSLKCYYILNYPFLLKIFVSLVVYDIFIIFYIIVHLWLFL